MKQLIKKQFILFLLIGVFIVPISESIAMMGMMGGHGSGGGGMGGWGFGGGMGDHMGGGMGWGTQGPQYNRELMTARDAENLAREYMERHTSEPYRLGNIRNSETYYMIEILRPDGELMGRLLVDKQTGNIHSLR
ncbi:MAG: hypothetical protein JRJ04_13995 [Deltaproteobacteria bacterium]|nr:hypothetical protein [Deltaproteobacteria bacterium]